MHSPATSAYLPPLEVNHEREGVVGELQATLHELTDRSQQWMLRAQLGEHA